MWFLYALLGAVGKSYSGLFRKKMAGNISAVTYMWVSFSFILLALAPLMVARFSQLEAMMLHMPIAVFGAALSLMIATQLTWRR